MDSSGLVVLVSVFGTLTAMVALCGSGLVAYAYASQRERRITAEQAAATSAAVVVAQDADLKALKAENRRLTFLRGNKLYSRAEQDLGFAASQSVIRLRVIKAQVDEELTVIEKLLDTKGKP